VIPINIDALLAKAKAEPAFLGVTGVTGVTGVVTTKNQAEERPTAIVTPPQPLRCDRCDNRESKISPTRSVTLVTPASLPKCDDTNEPECIATTRVADFVTPVTPVTPQKEDGAKILALLTQECCIPLPRFPAPCWRCRGPSERQGLRYLLCAQCQGQEDQRAQHRERP
jgi:hypothetical protein